MAEDDPACDEDEARALAALRMMDAARRRKMVDKLERMAREQSRTEVAKLKLVAPNPAKPKK